MKHHPICSSSFLSRNYLQMLWGSDLTVVPESRSFQRQFLAAQLSLLASYCALTNETVNISLSLLYDQQFITADVLTVNQFYNQINATIYGLILDISLLFRHSLDYLQAITHGNAIMSTYVTNWRFLPDTLVNSSVIRTRPVWYGNCSCARSSQCSLPMTIGNVSFPGLTIGCLPSSALLQSNFQCFYNQTCLDSLHYALFDTTEISSLSLPISINTSNHFPPNMSVNSLFDQLFIEQWFRQYDYEAFFRTCAVSMCTYTYTQRSDILYVVTTILGIFGGLNIVLRLICPFLITGSIYLINFIQNKPSTVVEM